MKTGCRAGGLSQSTWIFSSKGSFWKGKFLDWELIHMERQQIKVLCVEDSMDLAALLCTAIDAEPDLKTVGCLHQADGLLEHVQQTEPHIVLLDLTMPGKNPLQALREVAKAFPQARTIVFSGYNGQDRVDAAMDAGAWGYISKHQEIPEVLTAIRRVAQGDVVLAQ